MPRTAPPRYAHLAQVLSRQIQDGQYAIGTLLPTEESLCERHGVSRITVRGAMRELERQGMISRKPRVGTRVLARSPQAVFAHDGESVDGVLQFTQSLPFRCLGMETVLLEGRRARLDGLPAGGEWIELRGVRLIRPWRSSSRSAPRTVMRLTPWRSQRAASVGSSAPMPYWPSWIWRLSTWARWA